MMKFISRTLTFGWLVLFMGVNSVNVSVLESLPESTVVTTPHPNTTFILDLRITNRIYSDSLNDQDSEEYKSLRREVEQLFYEVYGPTSLAYLGTDQMIFRNGSVIVSAQLLFGTLISPAFGRSFFLLIYKQFPSPTLQIDPDYPASVNSVDIFKVKSLTRSTVAPRTTTTHPKTRFLMDIKITNRIYNSTLNDQESADYKSLRKEVDQLFFDVFHPTPLEYIAMDHVTFRNGSVIADAELLFGTTMINPILGRNLFVRQYKLLQSPQLAIDLNFVANEELPTQQPVTDVATTSTSTLHTATTTSKPHTSTRHITTHTTLPTNHSTSAHSPTHTPHSSTSLSPTSTRLNTTMHLNTNTTHSPKTTAFTNDTTTLTPNVTNITAASHITNTTVSSHDTNTTLAPNTTAAQHTANTTEASHNTNTTTASHNTANTTTASHNTTTASHNTANTTTTSHNTTTASHNTTTASHNTANTTTAHNITTTASHNTTSSPIHNITNSISTISSLSTSSPTTAGALVPGWGIALLVLAAVCLLLLIIVLIILLVMCCCWPSKRTVVKEPEVIIPPMYFNPDIPMYSTHSTVDSANGKQVDVGERPPRNRTGMYVVNK